ncbi:hypothetical protein C427_5369 [Paraglaciecola psychrophila 170]|uniref:Uncharacterized protein n=1 Tax=Paraglaciecola psychrophila 170 TaxID=1129794 RepID=K6Z660_9ALTE|nr:hypothetical protein C427_5369 [Paraglaciecola psychrophila 170]GAC40574.1 hypothetical protein GPSY_4973 [Paraglaciecola psychrophila 170]
MFNSTYSILYQAQAEHSKGISGGCALIPTLDYLIHTPDLLFL